MALAGRELILAVTGSIAAYKAAYLLRELRRAEAGVTVVAITGNGLKTPDAVPFETPEVIDARIDSFEQVLRGVANVA